ncbi:hypothetical protein NPX13_g3221 [Xylaria arbuscula]|uniref:Uncharacterized protein n=1 Tax=Xylaria arbuscula TaxID=114810 RepID=A0A9W8TN10_9PEZI|nr:hypothetical protein NPX13_g3221 [Xylaria arbuscula]
MTYLPVNDSPSRRVPEGIGQSDHAVDELQFLCVITGRADEQVLVAAAPVPDVKEVVVDVRVRGILQLEREGLCDVVRQCRTARDGARRNGGSGGGQ